MMTLQKNCVVEKRNIPAILEQLLKGLERRQLKFDHEGSEGGHTFSTTLNLRDEAVIIRLRKNKKKLSLECVCAQHGCHQYNLQEKNKGRAGVLYDHLFLQWRGIMPT